MSHEETTGYVEYGLKIDIRMLPQFGPLEGKAADTAGIATKRVLLGRQVFNFPEGRLPARVASTRPLRAIGKSGLKNQTTTFLNRERRFLPTPQGRGIRRDMQ